MRVLFTTIPGFGHFHPILPLAQSLRNAGHTVAVATAPSFGAAVDKAGLTALPAGLDWDESRLRETVPEIRAVPEQYQSEWLMKKFFLDRSPKKMIPDLLDQIAVWKPDVVVSGTYEIGGALAAEIAGIPYVSCSISFRWNGWILKLVMGKALGHLRKQFKLSADPTFSAFGRYLDLCLVPPSWSMTGALLRPALTKLVLAKVLRSHLTIGERARGVRAILLQRLLALDRRLHPEHEVVGANTHFVRHHQSQAQPATPPDFLASLPDRPTIYVSLGTAFSAQYPEVFSTILEALRDEPINLLLTVGNGIDPARFGAQPAHIIIRQYLDPDELAQALNQVDLCVCHAGYSTVMDALRRGIPMVLLPLAADQPIIAQTCFTQGTAPDLPRGVWRLSAKGLPIVDPERLSANIIRGVILGALHDPRGREAARTAKAELDALPGMAEAVRLVQNVVGGSANPIRAAVAGGEASTV